MNFPNQFDFESTFKDRLVELRGGRHGLRASVKVEASEPASGKPIMDFVASDETIDRYGEVISADGWDLTNYRKNPVFQNSHKYGDIADTLGRAVITQVKHGKLFQRIEFAVDANPIARIAYGLYKGKFLNAVSVGFIPAEWENGSTGISETPYRRKYLKQELLELSAVAIPANPNALALGVKSGVVKRNDLEEVFDGLKAVMERSASPGQRLLSFARDISRILGLSTVAHRKRYDF